VDEMNFKLIPDKTVEKEMNSLQNELIRTSGQLKVGQIKKYLIKKLELSESSPNVSKYRIYMHYLHIYITSLTLEYPLNTPD